jgi:hypothetical protein
MTLALKDTRAAGAELLWVFKSLFDGFFSKAGGAATLAHAGSLRIGGVVTLGRRTEETCLQTLLSYRSS